MTSDTQNDTSDQKLEAKMKRLYKENPPLNDTSELDAQLDEILAAHWQVSRAELKEPLAALIAQREQAAELRGRIDENKRYAELTVVRGKNGKRNFSTNAWIDPIKPFERLKELQATKPEKEG